MPSEERVLRAREVLFEHTDAFEGTVTVDEAISAMIDFADEGSGIGELLSAIDAWIADGTPETEQGILDARAALSQSS